MCYFNGLDWALVQLGSTNRGLHMVCVCNQASNTCCLSIYNQPFSVEPWWRENTHTCPAATWPPTPHPHTCTDTLLHLLNSASHTSVQTQLQRGQLLPHPQTSNWIRSYHTPFTLGIKMQISYPDMEKRINARCKHARIVFGSEGDLADHIWR